MITKREIRKKLILSTPEINQKLIELHLINPDNNNANYFALQSKLGQVITQNTGKKITIWSESILEFLKQDIAQVNFLVATKILENLKEIKNKEEQYIFNNTDDNWSLLNNCIREFNDLFDEHINDYPIISLFLRELNIQKLENFFYKCCSDADKNHLEKIILSENLFFNLPVQDNKYVIPKI